MWWIVGCAVIVIAVLSVLAAGTSSSTALKGALLGASAGWEARATAGREAPGATL
jgi:hypothetical protein